MNALRVTGGLAVAVVLMVAGAGIGAVQMSGPTLKEAAGGQFLVGAAIDSRQVEDPAYAKFIAAQFDAITAGNEMKPEGLQKVKGVFTFETADKIAAYAAENKIKLIGHCLLWHSQAPAWMFMDEKGQPLPREVALENLRTHITTVVTHFKGKVHGWDVVNEAIGDSEPYLRNTPALRAIGEDYVIKAFEFARAADPDVELYYNDYNIDLDYKREKALRLLKALDAAGVRPNVVGVQGHWLIASPSIAEIERGFAGLKGAGYRIAVTEMDVDVLPRAGAGADVNAREKAGADTYKDGLPAEMQEKLAARYAELFEMFGRYRGTIDRVTFWGTDDGHTWLNNWPVRGRHNHPMLFDREMRPKPAYDAVVRVLQKK